MSEKRLNQAEYMSLQLMEIESFRMNLAHLGHEKISFNEAAMLWVSKGHADRFHALHAVRKENVQLAVA